MMGERGFTLVEMSVVLVIVGLLVLTLFPALTALRQANQRSVTQNNLQALMQAAAAFVQASGCVPCPTPAATTGSGFGRVRGDTAAAGCNGCPTPEGIVPFVSLGISPNLARDGWGHWFTMRVDPALTVSALANVIPPTSKCSDADAQANAACVSGSSRKGICQPSLKSSASATAVQVTMPGGAAQPSAVLFLSHGSHGYGAFLADASPQQIKFNNGARLPFPVTPLPNQGRVFSIQNANGLNQFADAPMQDNYDDVMLYASRDALVSMLNNGACN